jgi:hypothetical protein
MRREKNGTGAWRETDYAIPVTSPAKPWRFVENMVSPVKLSKVV